jgi:hypothetical protein
MNAPKYRRIAAKLALKHGIHLTRSKEFNDLDAGHKLNQLTFP